MKKIIIILWLLIVGFPVQAAFTRADRGTSGAQFLKIGVGARALGMGEAYTAVADEATAAYWNPAGLTRLSRPEITAMHNVWLSGFYEDSIICAIPFKNNSQAFALGIKSLTAESFDIVENSRKVSSFTPRDTALQLSYARATGMMRWGVTVKSIRQELLDKRISGYGFDAGFMIRSTLDDSAFGMSVVNVGPSIDGDPLPLAFRAGVMHRFLKNKDLLISLDGYMPRDNRQSLQVGSEYSITITPALSTSIRAGYRTLNINDLGLLSGISTGFGVAWHDVRVDYVFVPYGDLGNTHRMSLGYSFGGDTHLRQTAENEYREARRLSREGKILAASVKLRPFDHNPSLHEQGSRLSALIDKRIEDIVDPEKMYTQAYLFYRDRKYRQAHDLLSEALLVKPNHIKAKRLLMTVNKNLLAVSKQKKRKKEIEKTLNQGKIIQTMLWKAERLRDQDQLKEALVIYNNVLIYRPDNKKIRRNIREIEASLKKKKQKVLDQKKMKAKKLRTRNRKKAETLYKKGLDKYLTGNISQAESIWKKVLAIDPEHIQARNALLRVSIRE